MEKQTETKGEGSELASSLESKLLIYGGYVRFMTCTYCDS